MENWKDISGFEGIYQVSDKGRVRSLDRKDNIGNTHKGKILVSQKRPNGYLCVHLSKNGKSKWFSVHRLVAEAFIEKTDDAHTIVNHIDNDPSNNNASNLEWTTYKGNMQWASVQGRMKGDQAKINQRISAEKRRTPVIATDEEGNQVWFPSQTEAGRFLGVQRRHIAAACRKEYGYKKVGGYSWEYADEDRKANAIPKKVARPKEELIEELRQRMKGNQYGKGKKPSENAIRASIALFSKPILQYDKEGNFIKEYPSAIEASRQTGISHVEDVANGKRKTAGKYIWKWRSKT